MANPKAQTLQEKFGFKDDELATPRHDEIMLWLDKNMGRILAEMKTNLKDRFVEDMLYHSSIEQLKADMLTAYQAEARRSPGLPPFEPPAVPEWPGWRISKTWEQPVMSGNFTVGFVDLFVAVSEPYLRASGIKHSYYGKPEGLEGGHLPGWKVGWRNTHYFAFEVKPTIRSLGEVIRQIRHYQQYSVGYRESESTLDYVIVSPDSRFQEQLEAQGIGFVQAP